MWLLEFKVKNDKFRDTIMRKISPLAGKRTSYSDKSSNTWLANKAAIQ
jgi:hypothetical protein